MSSASKSVPDEVPRPGKRRRGSDATSGSNATTNDRDTDIARLKRKLARAEHRDDPARGEYLRARLARRGVVVAAAEAASEARGDYDDEFEREDDPPGSHAASAAPAAPQPIVLVKIGVDGNDRSLSLTYDALIRMDAAVLLRSLKVDDAFSTELKDVPLSKCTVWLLPRVAGDEPTPQEEDAAVELRAAATIRDLLTAQRWTPSRLLFLRVRMPGERGTTPLPGRLQFVEHVAAGARMMRALLPSESLDGSVYPFFLPQDALTELRDFVEEAPSDKPQILLLTGPVKSGKTTVLHHVLPALIAEASRAGRVPHPVILRFAFNLRALPQDAAKALVLEAAALARRAGLPALTLDSPHGTLLRLGSIMAEFAHNVSASGRRLWMLLDEMQAPVLACETIQDASFFTATIKEVVGACAPHARIAMTGSGMVTFLNYVRLAPVNSFDLQAVARTVVLGETPTVTEATAMASDILHAYATVKKWPHPVLNASSDAMVNLLNDHAMLSCRPAVVAYVAGLMGDGRAPNVLTRSVEHAVDKVRSECSYDFVTALAITTGDLEIRVVLHALATRNSQALLAKSLSPKQFEMLRLLCEPAPSDAPLAALRLLPPYAALTKECVNTRGDLIVRWPQSRWKITERLRGLLVFFAEAYAAYQFKPIDKEVVSLAVVSTLVANGIGVKRSDGSVAPTIVAADVLHVPQLAAILNDPKNDQELRVHEGRLRTGDRYNAEVGLHVLRWIRNIAIRHVQPGSILSDANLLPAIVDAAAMAAVDALIRLGWALRPDGTPAPPCGARHPVA